MPQFKDESYAQNKDLLALITGLAQKYDATCAQISLAYLLGKRPYVVPIPGSRHEARIVENAAAVNINLSHDDVKAISSALDNMTISEVFGGTKK